MMEVEESSARRTLADAIWEESNYDLILRLTALLVLLHGPTHSLMSPLLHVLCGTVLIVPAAVRNRSLWWLISIVLAVGNLINWEVVDNHNYLIAYMSLICSLSLGAKDGVDYCRRSARLVIAAVFALAVVWKLAAAEYLDGSFLYFTLLTDGRFQDIAALIAGVALDQVKSAASDLRAVAAGGDVPVFRSSRLLVSSLVMSWFTLLIEGAIAIVYTLPSKRLRLVRHATLCGFVACTYWLIPVTGFGFALLVLGLTQCGPDDRRWRIVYLVLVGIIQFTKLPWRLYIGIGQ